MLVTHDYLKVQMDFHPFYEKPPLFFWLQAMSMGLFGVNEFAARFPNVCIAVLLSLFILYYSKKYFTLQFGLFWCLLYHGSLLPFVYYKSGIIDPVYNAFCFVAFVLILDGFFSKKYIYAIYAGLAIGLAVLTKGPVIPVIIVLSVLSYLVYSIRAAFFERWKFGLFFLFTLGIVAALVISSWLITEISYNGYSFLQHFFTYQVRLLTTSDAGHQQPIYYHLLIILIGCMPSSIFMVFSFFKWRPIKATGLFTRFNLYLPSLFLMVFVLIIFSLVQTKIAHYSSMAYIPVSLLAAAYIYQVTDTKSIRIIHIYYLLFLFLLIGLFYIALSNKETLAGLIKDDFGKYSLLDVGIVEFTLVNYVYLFVCVCVLIVLFQIQQSKIATLITGAIGHVCLLHYILIFILPKVEEISQKPMIDFIKEKQKEDCYIETVGFKSYAPYFYSNRFPDFKSKDYSKKWLLSDATDKKTYFISKYRRQNELDTLPQVVKLFRKGGYVFYEKIGTK
jgi:hypothetical protein